MKDTSKTLQRTVIIAIAALMAVCFGAGWHFGKSKCPKYQTQIIYIPQDTLKVHLTDTLIVPVYSERIKEIPVHYYIVDSTDVACRVSANAKIDTAKIISEFFTRNFYDQILIDDSTGFIRIKQIVELNRITSQELIFKPADQKIVNVFREHQPKSLRFGAGFDYIFKHDHSDMLLKGTVFLKDRYMFGIGYSFDNMKNISVQIVF